MNTLSRDLAWVLKDKYGLAPSAQLPAQHAAEFAEDERRLRAGEPVAYVIGWAPFLDCRIDLSERPLIPRPETEYMVAEIFKTYGRFVPESLLDLCCGSGCIGISALKHWAGEQLFVDFVDVQPKMLKQTKKNAKLNHIASSRFRCIESDLFSGLGQQKYELMICNPPYVDRDEQLAPELAFEPPSALFADHHGMEVIERVIDGVGRHLAKDVGVLYLEFGIGQEEEIEARAREAELSCVIHPDQFGVPRFAELRLI